MRLEGEGPPWSPAQKTGVGDPGAASKGLCGVGEDLVGVVDRLVKVALLGVLRKYCSLGLELS